MFDQETVKPIIEETLTEFSTEYSLAFIKAVSRKIQREFEYPPDLPQLVKSPDQADNPNPRKAGWLTKREGSKKWTKHWCVIKQDMQVCLSKSEKDAKRVESFSCFGYRVRKMDIDEKEKNKDYLGLWLQPLDPDDFTKRPRYFQFATAEEMEVWRHQFQQCCESALNPMHPDLYRRIAFELCVMKMTRATDFVATGSEKEMLCALTFRRCEQSLKNAYAAQPALLKGVLTEKIRTTVESLIETGVEVTWQTACQDHDGLAKAVEDAVRSVGSAIMASVRQLQDAAQQPFASQILPLLESSLILLRDMVVAKFVSVLLRAQTLTMEEFCNYGKDEARGSLYLYNTLRKEEGEWGPVIAACKLVSEHPDLEFLPDVVTASCVKLLELAKTNLARKVDQGSLYLIGCKLQHDILLEQQRIFAWLANLVVLRTCRDAVNPLLEELSAPLVPLVPENVKGFVFPIIVLKTMTLKAAATTLHILLPSNAFSEIAEKLLKKERDKEGGGPWQYLYEGEAKATTAAATTTTATATSSAITTTITPTTTSSTTTTTTTTTATTTTTTTATAFPGPVVRQGSANEIKVPPPSGKKDVWETCCPLRVRDGPSPSAKELSVIAPFQKVVCLEIQGNWMHHEAGWSMMQSPSSSSSAGPSKVFLVRAGDKPPPSASVFATLQSPAVRSAEPPPPLGPPLTTALPATVSATLPPLSVVHSTSRPPGGPPISPPMSLAVFPDAAPDNSVLSPSASPQNIASPFATLPSPVVAVHSAASLDAPLNSALSVSPSGKTPQDVLEPSPAAPMAVESTVVVLAPRRALLSECPVCLLPFEAQGPHTPRTLKSCGHVFCSVDVARLLRAGSGSLKCPQCDAVGPCVASTEHVPKATELIAFLQAAAQKEEEESKKEGKEQQQQQEEEVKKDKTPPPPPPLCKSCECDPVTLFCQECDDAFCVLCANARHRGPKASHQLQPWTPALLRKNNNSGNNNNTNGTMCTAHPKYELDLVCLNAACSHALICRVCREGATHREHSVGLLAEITEKQSAELQKALNEKLSSVVTHAALCSLKMSDMIVAINTELLPGDGSPQQVKQVIHSRIAECKRLLDERERQLLQEVDRLSANKIAQLETERASAANVLSSCYRVRADAERLLSLKDSHSFFQQADAATAAVEALSSDSLKPPTATNFAATFDLQQLSEVLQTVGTVVDNSVDPFSAL